MLKIIGASFLYSGITFAILRISGNTPWFRDKLHIYVNGPSIYYNTDFTGLKRISSCPGAESLSEFKILWISLFITGERNKELICRFVKYFCGDPIYPSNDLDSGGPMLTKMSYIVTNGWFITCHFTSRQLKFSLDLSFFNFSNYFLNDWPCFPHVTFINFLFLLIVFFFCCFNDAVQFILISFVYAFIMNRLTFLYWT